MFPQHAHHALGDGRQAAPLLLVSGGMDGIQVVDTLNRVLKPNKFQEKNDATLMSSRSC